MRAALVSELNKLGSRLFAVRLAETNQERRQAMALRAQIFAEEFDVDTKHQLFCADEFDALADHLLVIEKSSQRVVATYRLIASDSAAEFYSGSEFLIAPFLSNKGVKVEMSRACVHPQFRNGVTLSLLWQGVMRYAVAKDADYLFGMASFRLPYSERLEPMIKIRAAALLRYFRNSEFWADSMKVGVRPRYRMRDLEAVPATDILPELPSLVRMYLKAGAKIISEPAYDVEFNCIDFLSVLPLSELNSKFTRRFAAHREFCS